MKKLFCLYIFSILSLTLTFSDNIFAAEPKITYTVSMPFPSNHLFEVEINIQNFTAEENYTDISLPAWRPGRYAILNFSSVCEEYKGKSLKDFFDSYQYGLDSLDWKKYLGYAGLNLIVRHDTEKTFARLSTRESGDRLYISSVIPGTPSYKTGLDINDEIIAFNGYKVRSSNLIGRISDMKKGDVVKLTIMREEKLREFEITLEGFKSVKYKVEKIKDPSKLQKKIFEEWLNTK